MAFEKASVLFNIGGLYTQIGTRQDRSTQEGLDWAVDSFLRAAGTFQFIQENYNNAPCSDLGAECLTVLVHLMLGQARECLFEKTVLGLQEKDIDMCLELSQEAAYLSDTYIEVIKDIINTSVKDSVPYSWLCLIQIKQVHYQAMADYYIALGLINHQAVLLQRSVETLQFLYNVQQMDQDERPDVPRTVEQQKNLGGVILTPVSYLKVWLFQAKHIYEKPCCCMRKLSD